MKISSPVFSLKAMKKNLPIGISAVVIAIIASMVLCFWSGENSNKPLDDAANTTKQGDSGKRKKLPKRSTVGTSKTDSTPVKASINLNGPINDFEKSLSKKDRALYIPLSRALDDENIDDVIKYAALAVDSENEDIRLLAVEALSWFESKAVVEMIPFLVDPSENVATDARRRFSDILDGMEDEDDKLKIVSSVMRKLNAGNLLDEMSNRIVLTQSSDKAVKTLTDLIMFGNSDVRKKAIDTYREITGEIYQGREAALKWAKAYSEE